MSLDLETGDVIRYIPPPDGNPAHWYVSYIVIAYLEMVEAGPNFNYALSVMVDGDPQYYRMLSLDVGPRYERLT